MNRWWVTNLSSLYKSKISKINRETSCYSLFNGKNSFLVLLLYPRSIIRQVRFEDSGLKALTCQVHVEECRIQGASRSNPLYVVFVTSLRSSWWRRWRCLATCIETECFGRMTKSGPRPAPASRTPPRAWQKIRTSKFRSLEWMIWFLLEKKF